MKLFLLLLTLAATLTAQAAERPLLRDFMGINGHTIQFRPALYAPTVKLVRDYHPLAWDVGDDTSFATTFPFARNKVDWKKVYGSWREAGFRTNACIMFDDIAPAAWRDTGRDAAAYGEAFARYFGPGGENLVESIEIGNEPGKYSDAEYRKLFEAMAGGIRKGDPRVRIAPCAMNLGKSGAYSKSVDCLAGLEALYDVLNIHIYPEVTGWPTWERSYPEDAKIEFLRHLRHVLTWRTQNVPAKEVWLTEFGYDSTTKPSPATGDFMKWKGNTDTEQAQWIVRAWLVLAREGVDRAYLYFFNDEDKPQLHGSSGLTRNWEPKPSYHGTAWLQNRLGDCRFSKAIQESETDGYVYEFTPAKVGEPRVYAIWRPDGTSGEVAVPIDAGTFVRAERMPLSSAPAEVVPVVSADGQMRVAADGSVVLVWVR